MDSKEFNKYLNENYANIPEDYLWWIHSAVENGREEDAIKLVKRLFLAKSLREEGLELHSWKSQVRVNGTSVPFAVGDA